MCFTFETKKGHDSGLARPKSYRPLGTPQVHQVKESADDSGKKFCFRAQSAELLVLFTGAQKQH